MQLAAIIIDRQERAAIVTPAGIVCVDTVNQEWGTEYPLDMWNLIRTGHLEELNKQYQAEGCEGMKTLDPEKVTYAPLYRHPGKIWGIGLNYKEHAQDLSEKVPEEGPASFMKPDTAIVGYGDEVLIPRQSERTTAEGELGIIIGKKCRDVQREEWLSAVAGYVTIIDMTAEDILKLNPRYLTRSKSFDTFFSFGPVMMTPDEVEDVMNLNVATVVNGEVHAENTVKNMTFPPDYLVSFHSEIMTLLPGDIISTGTPGAKVIRNGDTIECRIDGFDPLVNHVRDLKESP